MTDELDAAGQPGGPSLAVQAMVDAEQAALIERIKAQRAPGEAEEARIRDEKLQRALDALALQHGLSERVKQLEAKLAVLERP